MIKTYGAVLLLTVWCLVGLSACTSGSWWQAKLLSGADTEQAIALEESQEPKRCIRASGSGSSMGVTGLIEIIEARGKKVSFQDCISYFNKTMTPLRLLENRMDLEP